MAVPAAGWAQQAMEASFAHSQPDQLGSGDRPAARPTSSAPAAKGTPLLALSLGKPQAALPTAAKAPAEVPLTAHSLLSIYLLRCQSLLT